MAGSRVADRFVYEPLDQLHDCTRLVEIEPSGSELAAIRCRVIQVRFSDRPKYRALSYMWGDETVTSPIVVNKKRFQVASNLLRALQFLRRSSFADSLFWIDAICINQSDLHEKNRQVRIMPHIYFRATAVLVWLGWYRHDQLFGEA
jgi:hypothetical protein